VRNGFAAAAQIPLGPYAGWCAERMQGKKMPPKQSIAPEAAKNQEKNGGQ
jgi:hypothetical protein